ncbi:MAG TPA: hypothetical protein VN130_12840 [Xanthobacteraceae bacterium]|nr:hypothetical protein [Xanthobacteraceae bacterium]
MSGFAEGWENRLRLEPDERIGRKRARLLAPKQMDQGPFWKSALGVLHRQPLDRSLRESDSSGRGGDKSSASNNHVTFA